MLNSNIYRRALTEENIRRYNRWKLSCKNCENRSSSNKERNCSVNKSRRRSKIRSSNVSSQTIGKVEIAVSITVTMK